MSNKLESLTRNAGRQGVSLRSAIGGLKHGEHVELGPADGGNGKVRVSYYERQSHGDNGQPVRGAFTGGYVVEYPNGKSKSFDHGPHARTEAARKKGADPNAKSWAAGQAHDAVVSHFSSAKLFNDRRT